MSEAIKYYWVDEESEVFSGKSLDEILDFFFSPSEVAEIKANNAFGKLDGDEIHSFCDRDTGEKSKGTLKSLVKENGNPEQLLTSYI